MSKLKKNKKRLNIKMIILLILILLIIVSIITTLILKNNKNYLTSKDYKEVTIRNKKYYQRLTNNTWKGEYHQDNFDTKIFAISQQAAERCFFCPYN